MPLPNILEVKLYMTRIRLIGMMLLLALAATACAAETSDAGSAQNPAIAGVTGIPSVLPPLTPERTATNASQPAGGLAAEGAGNADVIYVKAQQEADGTWTFAVTVQHPDTGWEDYADGWDVVTPDGRVLKPDPQSLFTRTLLHPHENEQPFTRSQAGIVIPDGVNQLVVRAHDLIDGFGGQEVLVDLTTSRGAKYMVVYAAEQ